ncbi:complex I NDUFA9 subunit family protein [Haloprofundus sp. MHR1]|uniref:complex I NDUFA9 subunit family protein n=1 Tax=Haloprofundus sp. MHR1 TaxID=2572921 RepID=UPI0010BF14D0|nr:complex I NDUFA9 subunit family protein [Haloprofundus sp. MHR1]QCJ46057.1 complex I NDUFA9 subunit family protein [Haloprofundus sp. MHR1]
MKVLVVGGTGFVGTHLAAELLDRGHEVTVLSRSPESDDLPPGVETARGDVTAYDSIEGAFEGKDVAVNLVALSPLFKPSGGDEKHFEVHLGGTENVVKAAEEHGVSKLVQMSALGADPNGPTAYIRSKGEAEDVVRSSELDWVVFRPSVIFGDGGEFVPFTKKLAPPYLTPLPGGGKTGFQPIWVGDIASMLADAAEDDDHVGQVYEIGGPEKLTLAEVARKAHGAEGRSVNVVPVPMGLAGIGLGIGGKIPGFPMGSDQYRSLKFDNTTDDNDIDAFGKRASDLKTLDAYLRDSSR